MATNRRDRRAPGRPGLTLGFFRRDRGDPRDAPEGPIFSDERRGYWWLWLFGGLFILISLPAVLAIPEEWAKGNKAILAALLFPAAGLWIVGLGVRQFRNWRFYGPAPLTLDPHPGQIGGDIGGRIQLGRRSDSRQTYRVNLQCLYSRVTGSGKNRRRSETLVWQDDKAAYREGAGRGTELSFVFQPPENLPASETPSDNYHFWRLLLTGPREPVALDRTYTLPARSGTGRSGVSIPERFLEDQQRRDALAALEAAAGEVQLEQISGGIRLHSPIGRHSGMKLGFLAFGLVFAASGGFLVREALDERLFLWLMAAPFLLIGVIMVCGGLFMLGRSLDVEITDHEIRRRRYWFGLPMGQRFLRISVAPALSVTRSGGSSDGRKHVEYCHIQADVAGDKLRIAEDIRTRDTAEALLNEIRRWLAH